MAKKTAKQIVAEAFPQLEVIGSRKVAASEPAAASPPIEQVKSKSVGAVHADSRGDEDVLSLEELEAEFRGGAPARATGAASDAIPTTEETDDVEIVHVRPKKTPADPANDPGPKAIIVSKSKGILGTQG